MSIKSILWAAVFLGMLYFAFTYETWDWWVQAVLVFSFLGIWASDDIEEMRRPKYDPRQDR